MLGLSGDVQRLLSCRLDLNLSGRGKQVIPVGYACDGGGVCTGSCQQPVGNRGIIIRPCHRVLIRVNHGFIVLDRDLRLFPVAVVQEGGFRQLHHRCDGLGVDGHRDRRCVHSYAGVVGSPLYLIIDGVGSGVGPGGNVGGEVGPIQRIDQEAHICLARRDQLLRLSVVGQ